MAAVFLSLGSNIDRENHIRGALDDLEEAFGPLRVSSIYESDAVGFVGDPFLNLVVGFATELTVPELIDVLGTIESRHGRTRDSQKFAPRTLDIDLLLYGDEVVHAGRVQLPRQDITRYAFMLEPLAEIAGDRIHPLLHKSYAELWQAYDKASSRQQRVPFARRASPAGESSDR